MAIYIERKCLHVECASAAYPRVDSFSQLSCLIDNGRSIDPKREGCMVALGEVGWHFCGKFGLKCGKAAVKGNTVVASGT